MAGEAKVKFLCSFGGRILPRPVDGALRYAGGHTRIIALRRDCTFPDLMSKMTEVLGGDAVVKYQLPDEDLDALVTVSCPDDLDNMMDEYDKLYEFTPDGSAKLRVFLFEPADPDPSLAAAYADDPDQRYVDALNFVVEHGSLFRKDSTASASSTQNSDCTNGVDFSVETATAVTEGSTTPDLNSASLVDAPPKSSGGNGVLGMVVNPPAQPQPLLSGYIPQQEPFGYVNYLPNPAQLHYISSQQFGLGAGAYGYVAVAPAGSYMPGVQIAPTTVLPSASKDNVYGGRVLQVGSDVGSKPVQSLSQLPPLPPFSNLQSVNMDRYGGAQAWHQVAMPSHMQHGHGLRLEDCPFCQKSLPHAHSDTTAQDVGGAGHTGNVLREMNPLHHSLRPEDAMNYRAQQHMFVATALPDNVSDQRVDFMPAAVALPPGCYDYTQIPKTPNESERIAPKKAENVDQNRLAFSPGIAGFPADLTLFGTTSSGHNRSPIIGDQSHHQHLPLYPTSQHPGMHPGMHDLLTNKVSAVDSNPAKIDMLHTLGPSFWEASGENPFSHARPVEGMMETLRLSSDLPGTYEQRKTTAKSGASTPKARNSESPILVVENMDNIEPVDAKELLGNAFISTAILPEGSLIKPAEQLPPSTLDITYLSNAQPTGLLPHLPGNYVPFPHLPVAGGEPPIPHKRLLGVSNANKLPVGDRREHISEVLSGNILTDVSTAPSSNLLSPLQNSGKLTENNASEVRNPIALDSLFSNPDPWGIQQIVQVQPSKPARVASGESLASKDSGIENHASPSGESGHTTITDKGNSHQPLFDLNRDPLLDLIPPMKDSADAQINQGLQVSAESLAASILQPSMPAVPVIPAIPVVPAIPIISSVPIVPAAGGPPFEINEHDLETHGTQGVHSVVDAQNTVSHDRGHEDGKPKQSEKLNHGFQIAEDIEQRLQIIKNSDLEELRELGSGTFGTVYHGKWRGTDVAIKRINDRCFAGKPSDQERMRNDFWNEACNLADLHHPNVVAFYGVVLDGPGGSVATVTEYMVNGSLRNALQRNDKTLDMRKCLLIAMDVAFGMEYLHGKKIVHFDLKSDNLLVNLRDPHRPICKVGDLGLSKVKCQTLISGGVRGTLPWMAPELLSGDSNLVSEKVDVFSFGIVMWELLTGEEPYADLHYGAIIGGIVNNTLRPPIPELCDIEWRSLMEKCWLAEPSERPSFTEVAGKLRAMAASYPRKGQPHPNPSAPVQK